MASSADYSTIPSSSMLERRGSDDPAATSTRLVPPPHQADSRRPSSTIPTDTAEPGHGCLSPDDYSRRPHHVLQPWIWEIVTLVLAMALAIAMFVIPSRYHDQPLPDWGYSINLNTLLALLVTIFRPALALSLASIVAQSKWEWFGPNRIRPLGHLQQFDFGSRSVWGSLNLLKTAYAHPLVVLSGLLGLVSLAVGPLVQQSVRPVSCSRVVSEGVAQLPNAFYVPKKPATFGDTETGGALDFPSPNGELGVLISTALASSGDSDYRVKPHCPSGNCTFPSADTSHGGDIALSTLALCQKCVDSSPLLRTSTPEGSSVPLSLLPSGVGVDLGTEINTDTNLTWMGEAATPELLHVSRWAYANVSVVSRSMHYQYCTNTTAKANSACKGNGVREQAPGPDDPPGVFATTCALYPCLRTYTSSMKNGILDEKTLSEEPLVPDITHPTYLEDGSYYKPVPLPLHIGTYAAIPPVCYVDEQRYSQGNISSAPNATSHVIMYNDDGNQAPKYRNVSAPEQCIYRQDGWFHLGMSREFVKKTFRVTCRVMNPVSSDPRWYCKRASTKATDLTIIPEQVSNWANRSIYRGENGSVEDTMAAFASFTDTVSAGYRTAWGGPSPEVDQPGMVKGDVEQTTVCVQFEWPWLLLPAFLVVGTAILLAWMIGRSYARRFEVPVWKESILPLLLYNQRLVGAGGDSHESISMSSSNRGQVPAWLGSDLKDRVGDERLLEVPQMERLAAQVLVGFDWPRSAEDAKAKPYAVSTGYDGRS